VARSRSAIGTALIVASVAIAGVATTRSAPDCVDWVTVLFRPAYQVVNSSDVDWGQGL
jgi:hypothetical protein